MKEINDVVEIDDKSHKPPSKIGYLIDCHAYFKNYSTKNEYFSQLLKKTIKQGHYYGITNDK